MSFRHSWGHMANPCYFTFLHPRGSPPSPSSHITWAISSKTNGQSSHQIGATQKQSQTQQNPSCAPLQWGSRSQGFVTPHALAAQMQGFSHDSHGPTWAVPQSHCSPGSTTRLPQTAPLRRDRRGLWKRHAPLPCFRKVSKSLMLQLLKAFAPLKWLK